MTKALDMTGHKYGWLTVLGPDAERGMWHTRCICGNTKTVRGSSLRSGNTKSCGCMVKQNPGRPKKTRYVAHIPAGSFIAETAEFITPIRNALAKKGVYINSKGELRINGEVEYHPTPYHALGAALQKCIMVPDGLELHKS